jgi:putative sigma-54 modulation protein
MRTRAIRSPTTSLAAMLQAQGIQLTRRTVAKYREDMGIPSTHQRRRRRARASIAVHSFPNKPTVVEPHILKSGEAIVMRPMTIEEAVKDAEFRDRDLLIFRNSGGDMFVLHRRRDGQMELVEIP